MSDLFWKINKFSEENVATSEKHTPTIRVKKDAGSNGVAHVIVDVGEGKHPSENEHHIQWVELRGNGLFLSRAEFTPTISDSKVTFTLKLPKNPLTVTALARCNLHGLWESKAVEIK